MAKNISTKRGKGRIKVPPSQLTASQRGRATRLGEIFYMDKPEGPKAGPRAVHGYSGVEKPTRRFTNIATYGKRKLPRVEVGPVEQLTTKAAKDAEALIDFENALTRQNTRNNKRKAAEQMADVEFNLSKKRKSNNKRKAAEQMADVESNLSKKRKRKGYSKGGKVVYKATGGKVKKHNGDQEVARLYDVLT